MSDLLRIATAGSVDDGKSTLIGRLLFDSKQILEDQLAAIERTSRERGDGYVNLALLTDGLRAEREQGITIDVAYRYFATARRKFIVADTPGHERYTRNMVTGASTADLTIVLVDARHGVLDQSRRHAFLSSLLGVSHLVVCINKMDLVGWDEGTFRRIEEEFVAFSTKLGVKDVTFIPVSALHGDNIVTRSANMPWYEGPPLLYHLEHVHIASDRNLVDMRFPVQWVVRPMTAEHHDYRGYAGQVASGVLRKGDEVVVLPSMARSRVARLDTYDGEIAEAFAPMPVTVLLEDDLDVSRGDMLCRPENLPALGREFDAMLCWMNDTPAVVGKSYVLRQTTRTVRASLELVRYRIDVTTLSRDASVDSLPMNAIGRVRLRTSAPLFYDDYKANRATGSFILVDEHTNDTVAGGMLMRAAVTTRRSPSVTDEAAPASAKAPGTHQKHVTPHRSALSREARFAALRTRGATVWMTGLSGSGKSTLGSALERIVVAQGRPAFQLDGDNLRHGLCSDLGFDPGARAENVRRAAHAARLLAEAGTLAIVTLISPSAAARSEARRIAEADGLPFLEVYVATPLEACERRDPKGLYARARAGEIPEFTGISAPYEAPTAPDVTLTGEEPIDDAVATLLGALRARGVF